MYSECQINQKLSLRLLHCVLDVLDLMCTHFDYAKHEQSVLNLLDMLQVWFDYGTLLKDQTDTGFNSYRLHSYQLPIEALSRLLRVCRNLCAALDVNES